MRRLCDLHPQKSWMEKIDTTAAGFLTFLDLFFTSYAHVGPMCWTLLIFYLGTIVFGWHWIVRKLRTYSMSLALKRTDIRLHNILFWLLMWGLEILVVMSLKNSYICVYYHNQLHGNHLKLLKMLLFFSLTWKENKIGFSEGHLPHIPSLFHYSSNLLMLASCLVTCINVCGYNFFCPKSDSPSSTLPFQMQILWAC